MKTWRVVYRLNGVRRSEIVNAMQLHKILCETPGVKIISVKGVLVG